MGSENRRLRAGERAVADVAAMFGRTAERPDFTRYRDNLPGFARDILGVTSATRRSDGTPYQDEILAAVAESPRVAIVAGHGTGKTRVEAVDLLGFLLPRPLSRVVIVAPQLGRQVRAGVFAEVGKLVRRARVPLPVEVLADRVTVNGFGPEWCALGVPATEPARLEGMHAEGGLLLMMDETKGISQDVFDAMMGALSSGDDSRLVVASTPGGCAGPFYRACTDTAGRWKVFHLSAEDSSLVSPQWVEDRRVEWGEESPLYKARVCGLFVDEGEGAVFPFALVEAAQARAGTKDGAVVLGVDVSRSVNGDLNVCAILRGQSLERFECWRSPDSTVTLQRVLHLVTTTGPARVIVDETGVGGPVVDMLRRATRVPVEGVSFGAASSDPTRFLNLRSELLWGVREAMDRGELNLPDDDALVADMAATAFSFDARGRIVIAPKAEIRARLGRSPDRCDALALACWGAGMKRARARWEVFNPSELLLGW